MAGGANEPMLQVGLSEWTRHLRSMAEADGRRSVVGAANAVLATLARREETGR